MSSSSKKSRIAKPEAADTKKKGHNPAVSSKSSKSSKSSSLRQGRLLDMAARRTPLQEIADELKTTPEEVYLELQQAFADESIYDDLQEQALVTRDIMKLKNDLQDMVQLAKNTNQLDAKVTTDLVKLFQLISDRIEVRMERNRDDLDQVKQAHALQMLRFVREAMNTATELVILEPELKLEFQQTFNEILTRMMLEYEG